MRGSLAAHEPALQRIQVSREARVRERFGGFQRPLHRQQLGEWQVVEGEVGAAPAAPAAASSLGEETKDASAPGPDTAPEHNIPQGPRWDPQQPPEKVRAPVVKAARECQ